MITFFFFAEFIEPLKGEEEAEMCYRSKVLEPEELERAIMGYECSASVGLINAHLKIFSMKKKEIRCLFVSLFYISHLFPDLNSVFTTPFVTSGILPVGTLLAEGL